MAFWNDANHRVDLFPIALLRLEQQQHEVGADGKIRSFGRDDQRARNSATPRGRRAAACQRVAADRIHLRMQRDREHPVVQIDEAGARIRGHDLLSIARAAQNLQFGPGRRQAVLDETAVSSEPDGVGQFERAQRPPVSPSHGAIDVVDRIRDLRCDLRRVPERRRQASA